MLPYLKRASASIADQNMEGVEHMVIDGVSSDGTREWLSQNPYIRSTIEKDNGMYDAVNKGLKLAKGDILAYLNCDEQYLPGTLEFVENYFKQNTGVDIIFGDLLLIRPDGSLVAFRKGYQPRWYYILTSHLYVLTCTMFFRRKIIEDGNYFDINYKAVGDAEFVSRVLRTGYKAKHIKRYMAAFSVTGKNMSVDERSIEERKRLSLLAPFIVRKAKLFLNVLRFTEKFFSGAYFQGKPIEYSVYTDDTEPQPGQRKTFKVTSASSRWKFQ
jgi:glycosyltransferase involved in cell wall biosynthesis